MKIGSDGRHAVTSGGRPARSGVVLWSDPPASGSQRRDPGSDARGNHLPLAPMPYSQFPLPHGLRSSADGKPRSRQRRCALCHQRRPSHRPLVRRRRHIEHGDLVGELGRRGASPVTIPSGPSVTLTNPRGSCSVLSPLSWTETSSKVSVICK